MTLSYGSRIAISERHKSCRNVSSTVTKSDCDSIENRPQPPLKSEIKMSDTISEIKCELANHSVVTKAEVYSVLRTFKTTWTRALPIPY